MVSEIGDKRETLVMPRLAEVYQAGHADRSSFRNGQARSDTVPLRALARMVYEIHVPYLIDEGVSVSGAMGFWYDDWSVPVRPVASNDEALRHLLNDSKFRSMVEIRYGFRKHLSKEYEAALVAVDAIVAEIRRSLD